MIEGEYEHKHKHRMHMGVWILDGIFAQRFMVAGRKKGLGEKDIVAK